MAKLPKKIITPENKETTLRQFISTAVHKPGSASAVTRVNLTLTEEDLEKSLRFQHEGSISRAEVIRSALEALERLPESKRLELFEEIRKNSPKAGRPPINK
ncbi:hypothetical protein [Xenorhabdus siamensis]|uniref:hypothetical protein n=1 Tax=Xenorhabdus siamensis TaxID=3136254 RepID=UPI0030F3DDC5